MLDPVAELAEHGIRQIEWILRDEIHPHALAAHQPHHQLDALDQRCWRVLEQQVGFVKEEHQLGLVEIADFGQQLEQLAEQPQQESGVKARRVHQLVGSQNVDHAPAIDGLQEIGNVEHRFAEEFLTALAFDLQQATLDRANRGRADVAVLGGEVAGVVAHMPQHRTQVFQVQQQQAAVVGDLEHQVEHAGLGLVEREHACQQQRTHVADGCAHRVARLAEHIPQRGRAGLRGGRTDVAFRQRCRQLRRNAPSLADARQVTLDIGHEHRHADLGEVLSQGLQRDCLAGACGAGDQTVAVGQRGQQFTSDVAALGDEQGIGHERRSWSGQVCAV